MVLEKLGLKSDLIRNKLKSDRLKVFENVSYLAHQIAYDHPPYWEYKLTLEVLRNELTPIHLRWLDLNRGLYVRKSTFVSFDELPHWLKARFGDASKIVEALGKIVRKEFTRAWGPDGVPGNELEILRVCRLLVSTASSLLEWEEDVRFTVVPEEFDEAQSTLQGVAGLQLEEIMRIPHELSQIFQDDEPNGVHSVNLVLRMPDGFEVSFQRAMDKGTSAYLAAH